MGGRNVNQYNGLLISDNVRQLGVGHFHISFCKKQSEGDCLLNFIDIAEWTFHSAEFRLFGSIGEFDGRHLYWFWGVDVLRD